MFTFAFLKYVSIILFVSLVTLDVVYLAYITYSKYFDLAQTVVKVLISIMFSIVLGLICFYAMTWSLIEIAHIILDPQPVNMVHHDDFMPALLFYLSIPVSLCVSFVGSISISIFSGRVLHKSLK